MTLFKSLLFVVGCLCKSARPTFQQQITNLSLCLQLRDFEMTELVRILTEIGWNHRTDCILSTWFSVTARLSISSYSVWDVLTFPFVKFVLNIHFCDFHRKEVLDERIMFVFKMRGMEERANACYWGKNNHISGVGMKHAYIDWISLLFQPEMTKLVDCAMFGNSSASKELIFR